MFSGLGVQNSTSRRSATHKCNGLCNLAYFLLGFTFPEGQKKTNKERRSCFSSRLAGGGPSTCLWVEAGVEPELCALGLGVGDWKSCLQCVAPLTDPLGRHCCVLFLLWIQVSFPSLTYTAGLSWTLCRSYQPAMHIPMTLQQCHDEAAAAQHRDTDIYWCT